MARLYGKPTKFIRHVTDNTYTIEPQRATVIPFWSANTGATSRTDGADLQDDIQMPIGSKIIKHKLDILVTPYTIEPQQIYIGRVKLSFHDINSPHVNGTELDQTAYQTGSAVSNTTSYLQFYPDKDTKSANNGMTNVDVSGIDTVKLDDNFKHFVNLKKVTVFDQRPLMGERWQRIPSKVKRINPYTYYGLWVFNDSPRGATPADTQIDFKVKQYIEEMAL